MRKVTQVAVAAFKADTPMRLDNTRVEVRTEGTFTYLFGNMIAHKTGNELFITTAGWRSNTTKERLNGILQSYGLPTISQRNWEWFICDEPFTQNKTLQIA